MRLTGCTRSTRCLTEPPGIGRQSLVSDPGLARPRATSFSVVAAAAYAVFMRPLHDLVINSGGLVLGVWGIRSLLTPGTATQTLVDLMLSMVILFLLGAITFRAMQYLYQHGGFGHRLG